MIWTHKKLSRPSALHLERTDIISYFVLSMQTWLHFSIYHLSFVRITFLIWSHSSFSFCFWFLFAITIIVHHFIIPNILAITCFQLQHLHDHNGRIYWSVSDTFNCYEDSWFTLLETIKVLPLTLHGHSRPITHLHFSATIDDDEYYLMSTAKGMLLSSVCTFANV